MVEIRLLGEQRVAGGAARGARPPSSRSIALLAYLALHPGIAVARSHLAGVFWPDSNESQARTNLRRELHELRSLLGACPSLVVDPLTLSWRDSPACRVDVRVFQSEREAAMAEGCPAGEEFLRHATSALSEYRGDLMPGAYDDWVLEAREGIRRQCVELSDLAVQAWLSSGDYPRAIDVARRRVQLEPLEEAGYRLLMQAHADSGDRAAAMTTYHRCASMLERELGVGPDPETTRDIERLLQRGGTPAPRRLPARTRTAATGTDLIGRRAELQVLARRWREGVDGRCGLAVVSGEAGVGKSRLVAELADRVAAEGAIVAVTRCFGFSGRLVLAPAAEWLRSSELRPGIAALDPVWQLEVERLVPEAVPELNAPPATAGPSAGHDPAVSASTSRAMVDAWQRHRFFEGLARAVTSGGRPTLLILDDLQWCDQETIAWLAFLVAFAKDTPLLVATTLRPEELDANRDVVDSLRALQSTGLVTEIDLVPLDAGESGELASSFLGRPLDEAEQTFFHGVTGGNPFLLLEAASSLPDPAEPGHAPDVADVQTVLKRRLAQPSAAAREVAGLAAAVGRDFTLDLLSEASDLDEDALVQAVDELWRLRILREQRSGYDFSHDLLREAAYATVSPARRWLLHRRLAQGLELLHAGHLDDVAAALAEQYDRGGRPDRALHYFTRAAQVAAGLFANADAVNHHRHCLELVGQLPAGIERDRLELDVLGQMSAPLNAIRGYSSPELQSTLERSAALAERLGRRQVLLSNLVGLFAARFVSGQTALAHDLATRALALVEEDGAVDLAGQAHFAFAGSALSLGMPATAIEHFDLGHDLSRGAMSFVLGTRIEVHAKAWEAHAYWLFGDDERAARSAGEAVQRGRAVDHPYSLAVALAYASVTHQLRGDRAGLRLAVDELRELCGRYEFAYYGDWGIVLQGWMAGGDPGVARIQEGIGRLGAQGAFARMPYWLSLLADSLIGCGRPESARAVLDRAWAGAEEREDRWWLPEVMRLRAGLEPGDRGVAMLRRAGAIAGEQQSRPLESRCRADLASRGIRMGSGSVRTPGKSGER